MSLNGTQTARNTWNDTQNVVCYSLTNASHLFVNFWISGMKVESRAVNMTGATTLGFTMARVYLMQDDVDDKCAKNRNLELSFLCHTMRDVHWLEFHLFLPWQPVCVRRWCFLDVEGGVYGVNAGSLKAVFSNRFMKDLWTSGTGQAMCLCSNCRVSEIEAF